MQGLGNKDNMEGEQVEEDEGEKEEKEVEENDEGGDEEDNEDDEDDEEDDEEDESKKKKGGICMAIIRFLASVGGLFIVLAGYIVGGAYAFIYFESKLEEEERLVSTCDIHIIFNQSHLYQDKLKMEERLNNSETFMVNYFTSLHYDPPARFDNCSFLFWNSDQYADYHSFSSACAASEFFTEFCTCIRMVRDMWGHQPSEQFLLHFTILGIRKRSHPTCTRWRSTWSKCHKPMDLMEPWECLSLNGPCPMLSSSRCPP